MRLHAVIFDQDTPEALQVLMDGAELPEGEPENKAV